MIVVQQDQHHFKETLHDFASTFTPTRSKHQLFFRDFVIFAGGLPVELNKQPSVTVMRGRSVLALEVGHKVVDFIALTSTPWACG